MSYPPPGVVKQWRVEWLKGEGDAPVTEDQYIARRAVDWELEACCEWLETGPYGFSIEATAPSMTKRLRAARRPKPPSLKEQALEILGYPKDFWSQEEVDAIRRALESLPD